ncbi:hypothetical protein H8M03_02690 [Sphingomonas sabuli]|uniref:Lipoprotein n=1 Tax=Sphingomonas sabuli TaxID=2764186 RepID=A0A7G9L3S1_9SPHN|nr:hypothetical protein [Sphingomonas sabuli]QNM83270.1 hypothetical protein H8M03_02690 [Sphingomonas sabuli]
MKTVKLAAVAVAVALSGCSSLGGGGFGSDYYSLIRVKEANVGDRSLAVTPRREWNRQRHFLFDDVRWVEDWTLNGPLLDDLTFVTGLPHGRYLIRTDTRSAQQVPRFDADMTALEITAMLESAYRVRGGAIDFKTLSIQPRPFLGQSGFQFDYEHLDGDELWRKGRAVGAVINGRLYLIMLDAARSHYYDDALPDFEGIVASARLR